MARPGIMLYFDMLEPIRVLPDADKGRLFVAILEYGKEGIEPEFDGMLAMAWGFIQPRLDRDGKNYENTKVQRKYAAFCKKRANLNLQKISFEEWIEMDEDERVRMSTNENETQRPVDFVNDRYPTTTRNTTTTTTGTTTITPTPTTNTSTTITAAVAKGAEDFSEDEDFLEEKREIEATAANMKKIKCFNGELGKGVVMLSEEQVENLLAKLDLDAFDYYVEKLANFILKNKAKVKNHYETILKWYEEDSYVH